MSIVVDRGAAAVDADFALVKGLEGLEAAGERVVEAYVGHFHDIGKTTIVAEARVWGKGRNGNAIAGYVKRWAANGKLRKCQALRWQTGRCEIGGVRRRELCVKRG